MVFSSLAPQEHRIGLETIYEGYLVHYGRSRLFAPPDRDTALLLGDYLYAHGLVRIAATGDVKAVSDLAELISRCAHGSGPRASTATGSSGPRPRARWARARRVAADDAVGAALAAHARLVG